MIEKAQLKELLTELRLGLEIIYGRRLKGLYLYGSYARGEATTGSDIDLMIVFKEEVSFSLEVERMNESATEILLEYGELISLYPISMSRLHQWNTPLLMNVQKEGICVWKRS